MSKLSWWLLLTLLLVVVAGLWWGQTQTITVPSTQPLPWQTEVPSPDKVKAFGVVIGESTLLDLRQVLDKSADVALLETHDGLSLEVYFGTVSGNGVLQGKLIAIPLAEEEALKALRKQSLGRKASASGWKYELPNAAIETLQQWPLRFLTWVPEADFSEERLLTLIGAPEKRLPDPQNAEVTHWFYGARGLVVTVNAQGREIFSYFAPQDLPWVEQRLLASPTSAAFFSDPKLFRLTASFFTNLTEVLCVF
jgi:hypothetical protein